MNKIFTISLALFLCFNVMGSSITENPKEEAISRQDAAICWFYLKGTIGKNNVRMYLAAPNDNFLGQYFYVSQGFYNQIDLKQSYYDIDTGHLIINEYVNGMRTGKFDGFLRDGGGEECSAVYTGTFTNFNGKRFKFRLYDDPMSPYLDD